MEILILESNLLSKSKFSEILKVVSRYWKYFLKKLK